jgi:hypothetical protein
MIKEKVTLDYVHKFPVVNGAMLDAIEKLDGEDMVQLINHPHETVRFKVSTIIPEKYMPLFMGDSSPRINKMISTRLNLL